MTQLHRWQQEALDTWDALDEPRKMTVAAVTGAGKTRLAREVIDRWPGPVTIIVPRRPLMTQWRDALSHLGPLGRVGGGPIKDWPQTTHRITIATIQSMSRGRHIPPKDSLLVVDECHNLRGPVYRRAVQVPHKACLGLSATPCPDENAKRTAPTRLPPRHGSPRGVALSMV